MEKEELDAYRRAGEIASEVRGWSRKLVKEGAGVFEITESIEGRIREAEAGIAFPVNVCINDVAAHYSARFNDDAVIGGRDVVTVDLGAHVDGFIADTAYTVDLSGDYGGMLKANKDALDEVLDFIKPGVSVDEIGALVQGVIEVAGYKPIENLTGHEMKQYDLHAGLSVPSIRVPYKWEIREGMVLAVEPFATDGQGRVVESKRVDIFSLKKRKPTRLRKARVLLDEIEERRTLPFAQRWFARSYGPMQLDLMLRNMVAQGILRDHPVLHEKSGGIVSQFEHTLIVTADGCEVTTI